MEASLTAFGVIVVPLVVGIAFFKRQWLLPALMVASTLQALSILDIDFGHGQLHRGVSAFGLIAIVITLSLSWRVKRLCTHRDWLCGSAGRNLKLWLAYLAVAVVGAALLPFAFGQALVYLWTGRGSFDVGLMPLHWSLSNLTQAANLILLIGVLIYIRVNREDRLLVRRMVAGLVIALLLSVLMGLWQRLVWHQNVSVMGGFNSGDTYSFISYAGQIARVSWPFTDATYGSAWYAAMFGGGLVVFFIGKRRQLALFGMIVSAFALLNSLGATGILAIGIFCVLGALIWVGVFVRQPHLRWVLGYQFVLAVLVVACCSLAIYIVLRHNGVLPNAQVAVINLLAGNNPTFWGDIQPQTNLHGLSLLRDSFGLGVGLGSNRASSYFVSLLSNTGVLGGFLFLGGLFHLAYVLIKSQTLRKRNDTALFLSGSLCTVTISVAIAIPDQNWPSYWVFILTSYAWISQGQTISSASGPNGVSMAESEIAQ
jgi:hypothetical protein